jgi:hypothetical protein
MIGLLPRERCVDWTGRFAPGIFPYVTAKPEIMLAKSSEFARQQGLSRFLAQM